MPVFAPQPTTVFTETGVQAKRDPLTGEPISYTGVLPIYPETHLSPDVLYQRPYTSAVIPSGDYPVMAGQNVNAGQTAITAGGVPDNLGYTIPNFTQSSSAQNYFGALPSVYTPTPLPFAQTPNAIPSYQAIETTAGNVLPYIPAGVAVSPTEMTFPDTEMPQLTPSPVALESGFPGVKPFTFDFPAEQQKAYESLKPFYDKLLSFSGGRLDLAKRILEYTYQQGMRESRQEYSQAQREQAITFPEEREQMLTTQHRRGVLESGFGKTSREKLGESQNLRNEAIQRALENRESRLTGQRGFGLEEKQQGFTEERFGLERERRKEATGMTEQKFGIGQTQFQSALAKAAAEESRRAQQEQIEMQKKIYQQQGYNL